MAITKRFETQITVLPDGQLQQRITTVIEEDGVELSRAHWRKVIDVGDDVTNEDDLTKEVAGAVHTPARVNARAIARAAAELPDQVN